MGVFAMTAPVDDATFMREALAEARLAASHGDVPVGAIVVDGLGNEIARGHNRREVDGDPVAHAEIVVIRKAAEAVGSWRLEGCSLFVTLEPCAMCAGALVNARVRRLVYGARDPKAGAVETLFRIADDPRLNHRVVVLGGVLAEEAAALLTSFFEALRARGEKWPGEK
jgi:tRNA(adenine34) deaminase